MRVVIADDEPITRMDLKEMLEQNDYIVVGEAEDGFDAVSACHETRPDLVLLDIKMPLLDGLSAAKIIHEEGSAKCIMLITAYSSKEFIDEAKSRGVMGYIVKPIDQKSLIPSIEVAVARSREFDTLKKSIKQQEEKLEERKLIEKAKGILMRDKGMEEHEAYGYLRDISMNKRISMKRLAEIIVSESNQ